MKDLTFFPFTEYHCLPLAMLIGTIPLAASAFARFFPGGKKLLPVILLARGLKLAWVQIVLFTP
jgi:hypothetical protein